MSFGSAVGSRSRGAFVFAMLFALSRSAAAADSAADDTEGARGLLVDVARIVAGEEAEGWFTDAEAFRAIELPMLESVCRATPDARARALAGLKQSRERAGDPRALYQAAGELDARAESALSLDRQLRALTRALDRTAECPFWLPPQPGFKGRQTDRQRWTFSLETGGNIQLRRTEGSWTFGGGGLGRLLPGYGINDRHTLLFGIEFGGGAMVRPNTSASQFVINYFPALPFVFRTHGRTWHYDVELAPVGLFQADNTQLSYGGRLGGAFAFSALRRRNLLPWAGLAVAYEYYFPGGGRDAMHFLRGGLRVGFQWDP